MSQQIWWYGPIYENSGYDFASRSYIKNLKPILDNFHAVGKKNKENFDEYLESVSNIQTRDVVIQHCIPPVIQGINDCFNILYSVWETDRLPSGWIEYCNKTTELWTSSKFSAESFIKSGLQKPIYVIPHYAESDASFDPVFYDKMKERIGNRKVVMANAEWIERKGWEYTLRSFLELEQEEVVLLVKTCSLSAKLSTEEISRSIKAIKSEYKTNKSIILINAILPREQVNSFYKLTDVFVTTSLGEAFCLPVAEALFWGAQIVAPEEGGHLEILKHFDFYSYPIISRNLFVDAKLNPLYTKKMKLNYPLSTEEVSLQLKKALLSENYNKEVAIVENRKKLNTYNEAITEKILNRFKAMA
jgi:glycosyltransferase involved in cell wall biosynthesis